MSETLLRDITYVFRDMTYVLRDMTYAEIRIVIDASYVGACKCSDFALFCSFVTRLTAAYVFFLVFSHHPL